MRPLTRSVVHAAAAALLLAAPFAGLAADTPNPSEQLNALVKAAQDKIRSIRVELDQLDEALRRAANSSAGVMGSAFVGGGRAEYSDVQRSTRELTDIGNRVLDLTSKCIEEARPVGTKFRSQTQRVQSDLNRIESATGAAMAQMAIGGVRRDIDAVEEQLQKVAGLAGSCGS